MKQSKNKHKKLQLRILVPMLGAKHRCSADMYGCGYSHTLVLFEFLVHTHLIQGVTACGRTTLPYALTFSARKYFSVSPLKSKRYIFSFM